MHAFHKLLMLFAVSFFVSGAFDGYFPQFENVNALMHGLFICFMLFALCTEHINKHEVSPPKGSKILCALIPPIGVPYYSWKSFGFKIGTVKVLYSIIFFAFSMVVYFGGWYVFSAFSS